MEGKDDIVRGDVPVVETILSPEDEDNWVQSDPREGRIITAYSLGTFSILDMATGRMLSVSFTDALETMKRALQACAEARKEDCDAREQGE